MIERIDIIIPVYNACDEVRACVESVLACTPAECYRLILINDASPEPAVADYFQVLRDQADERVLLLENEHNLGFIGTANRGMQLSRNNIVLLNSDTLVTTQWLERMLHCAASDARIGTITPFSNNAEICSFPDFCQANPVPDDSEQIAEALRSAAVPVYPELPTGVGFCFYIRRALLDRIGYFDADAFGRGYGEENDFCQRAIQAGYKNVLCGDAYVVHLGGCSFSDAKQALMDKNMAVLLGKHPNYMQSVQAFIEHDPIRPIRQAALIELDRLTAGDKPAILHVLHSMGGGARKYVDDLVALTSDRFRHYRLIATGDVWTVQHLTAEGAGEPFTFNHRADEIWLEFMQDICCWLGIRFCHVHQISEGRLALLAALVELDVPYGVSLHDFDLATPGMQALFAPDAPEPGHYCPECLQQLEISESATLTEWNQLHQPLLQQARFVMAPSRWTAEVYQRLYPKVTFSAVPNVHCLKRNESAGLKGFLLPQDEVAHIAIIGAIGPIKGSRHFEKLVEITRAKQLPLRWILIGYTDRQYEPFQSEDLVLTVHGAYEGADLHRLIRHYAIDLAAFPSAGPETFCYALSEAWASSVPVVVPPIGALRERVEASGAGWVLDDWLDMERVAEQITGIVDPATETDFQSKRAAVIREQQSGVREAALQTLLEQYEQHMIEPAVFSDGRADAFRLRVYRAVAGDRPDTEKQPPEPASNTDGRLQRWGQRMLRFTSTRLL